MVNKRREGIFNTTFTRQKANLLSTVDYGTLLNTKAFSSKQYWDYVGTSYQAGLDIWIIMVQAWGDCRCYIGDAL